MSFITNALEDVLSQAQNGPNETNPIIQFIIDGDLPQLQGHMNDSEQWDINGLYPCSDWSDHITPLMAAVISKKEEIVTFLLEKDADPNKQSARGMRPLHYASYSTVNIVEKLVEGKASHDVRISKKLNYTPIQYAVYHNREAIVRQLIRSGALPEDNYGTDPDIDKRLYEMIQYFAKNNDFFDKIKTFFNFVVAVRCNSPKEVFLQYGKYLLEEHPVNHLTILDMCFGILNSHKDEYQQTSIMLLKPSKEIDHYVEEAIQRFPRIPRELKETALRALNAVFCIMTDTSLEVSHAVIPVLLKCLAFESTVEKQEDFQRKSVTAALLKILYVIVQKTTRRESWSTPFLEELCQSVVPFSHPDDSVTDARIFAYGLFADLYEIESVPAIITSLGVTSVPEDVLLAAEIRMEDLKDKFKKLNMSLNRSSSSISPSQNNLYEQLENGNIMGKNSTTEESISPEVNRPLFETSTKPKPVAQIKPLKTESSSETSARKWDKKSMRWRPQLERLANMELSKVRRLGSISIVVSEDFEIAKGKGSNGTQIFLGLKDDGTEVAVKRMLKSHDLVLQNEQEFLRLPELDCKHIVRYIDFAVDDDFVYLALQLCEYTLEEYIQDHSLHNKTYDPKKTVCDVLESLKVIHSEEAKVIHRDIKPQNVLIDVVGRARLADFGISRRLKKDESTVLTGRAGTKCWKARETIEDGQTTEEPTDGDILIPYKRATDIQVAGMLVYYILSGGQHPFGSGGRCETNILDGKYTLEHVKDEVAKDLIVSMISKEQTERPSIEEVLAHPYFWTNKSMEDYLIKIGNVLEARQCCSADQELLQAFEKCTVGKSFSEWKSKFPLALIDKLSGKRGEKAYPDNTLGLLRFIRNLHEHHHEDANNINLSLTFPDLFGSIYLFAKERNWNKRPSLIKCFQE
ncbi:probable serine/threonine-protein kinase irlA [Salmo trutta]|uniref:Probable serine/threonine-protein kinase irlA n=1 Tax=Salmo trutta TaxID=8032 RepID=A0A674DEI4_SALTR|nr:probable serine/threonine-protein kinase irlA [Salmo trutta]